MRGGESKRPARALRLPFFFVGAVVACAPAAPGALEPAGADVAARSGATDQPVPAYYSSAQADRGEDVFGTVCSTCHGRYEFTGPIFALTWMEEPVGSLFQHIRTAMPQDDPGSLSAEEYAAVVAYMLRLNGREAGDRVLPADAAALGRMRW